MERAPIWNSRKSGSRGDSMNSRQLARFRVDEREVRDRPGKLAEVFAMLKFVPVRAECLFAERCIEYVGISERFVDVPDGQIVPEVELRVTKDSAGGIELVEVIPTT